jgi:thymidine kinase
MSISSDSSNSSSKRAGSIIFITGPMCSGKTKEMDRLLHQFEIPTKYGRQWKVTTIKYSDDHRYETTTVGDSSKPAVIGRTCLVISNDRAVKRASRAFPTLKAAYDYAKDFDVIGVDEGQFFPDIVEYADRLANEGHIIIISALSGKFDRTPFGHVLDIIPKAEKCIFLQAKCVRCGADAPFTARLDVSNKNDISIGTMDDYEPVCRACHNIHMSSTKANPLSSVSPSIPSTEKQLTILPCKLTSTTTN